MIPKVDSVISSVLIVEPQESDAHRLNELIQDAFDDMNVMVAATLEDATHALRQFTPECIFCSLDLPDRQGFAVLAALISAAKEIPCVIMQRDEGQDFAVKALKMGAQDVVHIDHINTIAIRRIVSHSVGRAQLKRQLREVNETLEMKVFERTRELEVAKLKAEQAESRKTEFFMNITHELRTPLHAIINFSQFGMRKVETAAPEKLKEYFSDINGSGKRLLALVNDILDLAKYELGKGNYEFKRANVLAALSQSVKEMGSLLEEKDIAIEIHHNSPEVMALIDHDRMVQVFVNIIGNAIKFTGEGTTITVTIEEMVNEGDVWSITVDDQGPGIPEDELKTVFDEFAQSNKIKSGHFTGGTGLGLAICKRIVQAHNGIIYAANNTDGGASMHIELPK